MSEAPHLQALSRPIEFYGRPTLPPESLTMNDLPSGCERQDSTMISHHGACYEVQDIYQRLGDAIVSGNYFNSSTCDNALGPVETNHKVDACTMHHEQWGARSFHYQAALFYGYFVFRVYPDKNCTYLSADKDNDYVVETTYPTCNDCFRVVPNLYFKFDCVSGVQDPWQGKRTSSIVSTPTNVPEPVSSYTEGQTVPHPPHRSASSKPHPGISFCLIIIVFSTLFEFIRL